MPKSATNGKRKLNIIDYLLILLIAAVVAFAIVSVISANPNSIAGGDTKLTVKIKCDMVETSVADKIKFDDSIYDNETNQLLGKVVSIERAPITAIDPLAITPENPTGTVVTDKVTLTIVIASKAWKDDGIYSIDRYKIAAGQNVDFHSAEFSVSGFCTSVAQG